MSEPARPLDHLSRVQADANTPSSEPVRVQLAGRDVDVKPLRKWRSSAISAMRSGDFEVWARTSLDGDGYDVWLDVDPTIEEVEALFAQWTEATGQSPGESSASRR